MLVFALLVHWLGAGGAKSAGCNAEDALIANNTVIAYELCHVTYQEYLIRCDR